MVDIFVWQFYFYINCVRFKKFEVLIFFVKDITFYTGYLICVVIAYNQILSVKY